MIVNDTARGAWKKEGLWQTLTSIKTLRVEKKEQVQQTEKKVKIQLKLFKSLFYVRHCEYLWEVQVKPVKNGSETYG